MTRHFPPEIPHDPVDSNAGRAPPGGADVPDHPPDQGTDRASARWAVVHHIRAWSPDVVGLCEVFDDDERIAIRDLLTDVYPHYRGGPDEADLEALFGGREELYAQLSELADFVAEHADPEAPTLVMGDLNVPADDADAYRELHRRLRGPIDLWRLSGRTEAEGCTVVADSNFFADPAANPRESRRLDYVLLRAGTRHVPLLDEMRVLRIRAEGRDISDHLGLLAQVATSWLAER